MPLLIDFLIFIRRGLYQNQNRNIFLRDFPKNFIKTLAKSNNILYNR